ncbi:DUF6087 family protein [Kitasatospora cinereorecta]|uniref:DUF6087 family protein n=1 Tax=Kitasatospora cinereorecta TaxID=285560 RepID=A0ABW0V6S9_9ACTN
MDLNTVTEVQDARERGVWQPGDAWLGGGAYLFSEPQIHIRRLLDLGRMGWTPLEVTAAGDLRMSATCTIAQLSRYPKPWTAGPLFEQCGRAFLASWKIWNMATVGGNPCNGLSAGPVISLACEQRQKPLSLLVTAGQRGDSPQFTAVLEAIRVPRTGPGRPRTRPLRVRGDKAYSSKANRAYALKAVRLDGSEGASHVRPEEPRLVMRWDGVQWLPETVVADYGGGAAPAARDRR